MFAIPIPIPALAQLLIVLSHRGLTWLVTVSFLLKLMLPLHLSGILLP
jgi:hypothetical protein